MVIQHLYVERRVRPLNLYLAETNEPAARAAVIDYGQAIKDLAATNIFPGDLLPKNFGVTRHETTAMLQAYDFSPIRVLADIGGGNGSLIGAVLQRYTKLKGLLFDLSHVVGRARESLAAYAIDNRCSVIEGNFFESVPSGADTYLFRHIIHDWTDEQSVQILDNCRKVIHALRIYLTGRFEVEDFAKQIPHIICETVH